MPKPIQISIPQPCHEKWADMTPADKGRFCASCEKNVIDFTRASDREIAQALRSDKHLCGRFMPTQLERDLIIPKEKSSVWAAASAAVLTFLTIGSNEASAQTVKTEQTDKNTQPETFVVTGVVSDETGVFPGVTVFNKNSGNSTLTDMDGAFSLNTAIGDTISFSFVDYDTQEMTISNQNEISVRFKQRTGEYIVIPDKYRNTSNKIIMGAVATISIEDIIAQSELRTITGIVSDKDGPIPGASIIIKGTQLGALSDIDGNYTVKAKSGDILVFSSRDYDSTEVVINDANKICVVLSGDAYITTGLGVIIEAKQRTFFGRIFHSIGNWLR